jgi:hypothetical protein
MEKFLIRIPVDFNTIFTDPKERVLIPTHIYPDLLKKLKSGLKVIVFEENDFEVEAIVVFDKNFSK